MLCFEAANMAVPVLLPDLRLLSRQSFGWKDGSVGVFSVWDERELRISRCPGWLVGWLVGFWNHLFFFWKGFFC